MENLPAFPREKLTLRLLLGSGAFGEVYEGTAVDILGAGSGETKVAVKVISNFNSLTCYDSIFTCIHKDMTIIKDD